VIYSRAVAFYNNVTISIFEVRKKRKVMKVLNLIIKQKYFDAILAGRKVQEFREVRPTTINKLLQLDEDGYEVEDEDGNAQPIKYDAIQFFVGYNKDRDSALVEVVGSHCEIFVNDKGEPITYEYGRDKEGKPLVWVVEQVVYDLGKILDHNIREKSKTV
jgi:hypothetical protein